MDAVEEGRFRGEPAVIVSAGELSATFLPDLGMTGVSLRCRGREHLALPGGLPALRSGATLGLPLLAPWANRLGSRHYRAAGVDVDLTGLPLGTDANGLPDPRSRSWASRDGVSTDARLVAAGQASGPRSMSTRRRSRTRTGSRSSSSPVSTSSRSTRRSSRPAPVRSRWRSDGTPTCGCRARHGASGSCDCRLAPISPSTSSASRPAGDRAEPRESRTDRPAHLRRPVPPRPPASPRAGGRRRLLDHAPLRTRVSVRAGVGTGRPTVRRAGADGSRHEQPGRRHHAARGTRRGVHRQLHALGRGTAMSVRGSKARGGRPEAHTRLTQEELHDERRDFEALSRHRRRWLRRRGVRQRAGRSTTSR